MFRELRFVLVFMVFLVAGGCALIREPYRRPEIAAPAAWLGKAPGAEPAGWPDREWWKCFLSAELDRLIALAQENNYDLKAAMARVAQARASLRIAGAGLYPALTFSAGAQRSKVGDSGPNNAFSIGPLASYEIDIWGRNRFTRDAAEAALLSSTYAQEVVRLTLTADVANTYFQAISLSDRIRVTRDNLANARKLLDLVEAQRRAGKVSGLEVERQRSQVATTEAAIPPLLQQLQQTRDALAVLLGKNPGEVELTEESLRPLSLPVFTPGLPSELLERRPDIRRAEADLISANANISAARAALFPSISLSGQRSYSSVDLSTLFEPGSGMYRFGLDVLATIFEGGRLFGQVDLAKGRKKELVAAYYQAIVLAFRDVEDALAGIEQFSEQEKAQQEAALHAREAYRIAEIRYRLGADDFTIVLDAERTMLSAEAAVDPVRLARFTSFVGLFRALGGGW
jgi:NodT family efflux transporter outer membrane factor (OMF) lipoprotein